MKNFIVCSLAIAVIAAMSACNKNGLPSVLHSSKSADTAVDVYVVGTFEDGNNNTTAAYWKNGNLVEPQITSFASSGTGIAVKGTDVYLAGDMETYDPVASVASQSAGYWKNGIAVKLNVAGSAHSHASDIAFSGNDMYIGGLTGTTTNGPQTTAIYWKNGVAASLPNSSTYSEILAVTVNNNDVYFAGSNVDGGVYWKNGGFPVTLSTLNATYGIKSMAVNGSDVYITGTLNSKPAFWKNGIATVFQGDGEIAGIGINGTDLYTAGTVENSATGPFATFWAGNASSLLSPGNSFVSAMCINGKDVYIAGSTFNWNPANTNITNTTFCYWKNGMMMPLNSGSGRILELAKIIVVPR